MNLALLLGLLAFVRGSQSIVWTPTARMPLPLAEPLDGSSRQTDARALADQRMARGVSPRAAELL
jgi:hypothetical protein